MLRNTTLSLLVLCLGCADDSEPVLKDGPSVGTTCGAGPRASLAEVPRGSSSAYTRAYADLHGTKARITLLPGGELSLTQCQLSWTGSGSEYSWQLTIQDQQLGTFDVAAAEVSVWTADDSATTGSVTLEGYDADAGRLCGSVDAVVASGGRLRGAFVADVFCE